MRKLLYACLVAGVILVGAGWTAYTFAMNRMAEVAVQQQTLAGKIETMDAKMSGKFETLGVKIDENSKDHKK